MPSRRNPEVEKLPYSLAVLSLSIPLSLLFLRRWKINPGGIIPRSFFRSLPGPDSRSNPMTPLLSFSCSWEEGKERGRKMRARTCRRGGKEGVMHLEGTFQNVYYHVRGTVRRRSPSTGSPRGDILVLEGLLGPRNCVVKVSRLPRHSRGPERAAQVRVRDPHPPGPDPGPT